MLKPNVPKPRKAVMCLTEKRLVLDQLHSRVSHSAVGHEVKVNESTIGHIQKKEERICRSIPGAAPGSAKIKSTIHDETMEKWLNLWTPFGINA